MLNLVSWHFLTPATLKVKYLSASQGAWALVLVLKWNCWAQTAERLSVGPDFWKGPTGHLTPFRTLTSRPPNSGGFQKDTQNCCENAYNNDSISNPKKFCHSLPWLANKTTVISQGKEAPAAATRESTTQHALRPAQRLHRGPVLNTSGWDHHYTWLLLRLRAAHPTWAPLLFHPRGSGLWGNGCLRIPGELGKASWVTSTFDTYYLVLSLN